MKIQLGYDLMAGIYFPVMKIEQQSFHFGISCDTKGQASWWCKQMDSALRKITTNEIEFIGLIEKFK